MKHALVSCLLVVVTAGCAPSGEEFGIRVASLEARPANGGMDIRARQEIRFSAEAREALRHGVPLRIRVDVTLRATGNMGASAAQTFAYEIRYLPLSDHYQLSGPDTDAPPETFPRLRHVLAELGDLELRLGTADQVAGQYEVRMRSRLDRSAMPGPMQLPVFLSPQWAHDSGWVSSKFQVNG